MDARTFFAPAPDLADVIEAYWMGAWDLREPHVTELLPDPCVHFVFEGGDREERRAVGVWTRRWTRALSGRGHIRAVKLRPGAVRAFVEAPAAALTNRIVPLEDAIGPVTDVLAHDDDERAFAAFADVLRARRRPASAEAIALVARAQRDPEIRSVEALAQIAGVGPRALQRLFREHVGASPKWVIRVRRLQEAALRIERGEVSLAALAAELGYTDQAHMARDFKTAVGKSPTVFARDVR